MNSKFLLIIIVLLFGCKVKPQNQNTGNQSTIIEVTEDGLSYFEQKAKTWKKSIIERGDFSFVLAIISCFFSQQMVQASTQSQRTCMQTPGRMLASAATLTPTLRPPSCGWASRSKWSWTEGPSLQWRPLQKPSAITFASPKSKGSKKYQETLTQKQFQLPNLKLNSSSFKINRDRGAKWAGRHDCLIINNPHAKISSFPSINNYQIRKIMIRS